MLYKQTCVGLDSSEYSQLLQMPKYAENWVALEILAWRQSQVCDYKSFSSNLRRIKTSRRGSSEGINNLIQRYPQLNWRVSGNLKVFVVSRPLSRRLGERNQLRKICELSFCPTQ